MSPWLKYLVMFGWFTMSPVVACRAQEKESPDAESPTKKGPFKALVEDLNTRTLGGGQFWTDELVFRDWRIQRNALSGHCRLLDGDNRRHASGTFEQCETCFEGLKRDLNLTPISGRVVVLVHGLGGQRTNLNGIADHLAKNTDLTPINVGYASTRATLDDHARVLTKLIERLGPDVTELNVVAYSMGNLVVRRMLHDTPDPRLRRMVMIAPPNHGAERAEVWGDNALFLAVVGGSAHQMGAGWESTVGKLARPACEFGIIAGCRGNSEGYSSKVSGDDDFVISVSTTRLAGARDFALVTAIHSLIPLQSTTRDYVLSFLEHGYFKSEDKREPVETDGDP